MVHGFPKRLKPPPALKAEPAITLPPTVPAEEVEFDEEDRRIITRPIVPLARPQTYLQPPSPPYKPRPLPPRPLPNVPLPTPLPRPKNWVQAWTWEGKPVRVERSRVDSGEFSDKPPLGPDDIPY